MIRAIETFDASGGQFVSVLNRNSHAGLLFQHIRTLCVFYSVYSFNRSKIGQTNLKIELFTSSCHASFVH